VAELTALVEHALYSMTSSASTRSFGESSMLSRFAVFRFRTSSLRQALTDWRGMLRRELPMARRVLRALLAGRLMFAPGDRLYTFEGHGTITPLLVGAVGACAKGVVAPTGTTRLNLIVPLEGVFKAA
jgi:hypothetical protein